MRVRRLDLVPPDLRDSRPCCRKAHYAAAHQPQTLVHSKLEPLVQPQLPPNAQTDDRLTALSRSEHMAIEPGLAQPPRAFTECPNARQDQSISLPNNSWIASQHRLGTHRFQRLLDAAQVSYSIVDYGEHQ